MCRKLKLRERKTNRNKQTKNTGCVKIQKALQGEEGWVQPLGTHRVGMTPATWARPSRAPQGCEDKGPPTRGLGGCSGGSGTPPWPPPTLRREQSSPEGRQLGLCVSLLLPSGLACLCQASPAQGMQGRARPRCLQPTLLRTWSPSPSCRSTS